MKLKLTLWLVVSFISTPSAFAQKPTEAQIWTNADFVFGLVKGKDAKGKSFDKVSLTLTGIVRIGDKLSRSVDERVSATLDFRLNKYFNLTTGYLHQRAEPLKNSRNEESRFILALTGNKRTKDFNFRAREQLDYKFRNGRNDNQNYRSLFQVNYFLKRNKKDVLSPFVSNEFYFDSLTKSVVRNEFRAGINKNFTKVFSADFYYIKLYTKVINADGLGIGLKFKLR